MMSRYHLVVFEDEQATAVVPQVWMKDTTECYWPPYKTSLRINSAAQKEELPGDGWSCHSVRPLFNGSWEDCRRRLKRSEETSDLQSDQEPPAKRQKSVPRRFELPDMEDDESESSIVEEPVTPPPRRPIELPLPPTPLNVGRPNLAMPLPSTSTPVQTNRRTEACDASFQENLTPIRPSASGLSAIRDRMQEARDARTFAAIEGMKNQLSELKRLVRILVARGNTMIDVPAELPEEITFPVDTNEGLERLEDRLKDQQTFSAVVRYLSEYAGGNANETIARCLRVVISTNVARGFNYKGTKGKKKFEDLRLSNVLFRCLQANPSTKNCNRKDLEAAVQKWLGGARDRDGGRKSRIGQGPQNQ